MSEANVKVTILVVVRPGNRDLEDCKWFEAVDETKDEIMKEIHEDRSESRD